MVLRDRDQAEFSKEFLMKEETAKIPLKVRAIKPFPFSQLSEKSRSSIDSDGNWLITLSDLLSLLLVCFVVFFVMTKNAGRPVTAVEKATSVRAPAPDSEAQKAASVNEAIMAEMNAKIKKHDLGDDVSVRAVDREIIITMKEKVTFRPGEAETLEDSKPILDNIARVIQQHDTFQIEIEGHTDNVPIKTQLYPSNWELSVARATSVLKYFISDHGISPSRLSIKGNADQKPVAENDTQENRAQNRRVEIRLKAKEA
jgi:chemotaxis protein MotB